MKCQNVLCKHHGADDKCSIKPCIGPDGLCAKFERSIAWYFFLVWDALKHKNYIDAVEMTPDLRIGLYYVMRAFHLGFTEREWGTCRLYTLQSKEHGPNLGYEDIIKLPIDEKELAKLLQDFNAGILPGPKQETPKRSFQPFGWLSPAGEFVEAAFGDHESAAREIIRKMGYDDEQITRLCPTGVLTCRDYLSEMKGYCLIHNPMGDGGYIVSHVKPLTKRQCEYLYGYFMDMGDRFKAEQFLKDV